MGIAHCAPVGPVHTSSAHSMPCRSKPSERRVSCVGRHSAKPRRCSHRTKRSVAPCRSAPDRSLSSCTLGNGTCIDSASFLMPAPRPIGDKPITPETSYSTATDMFVILLKPRRRTEFPKAVYLVSIITQRKPFTAAAWAKHSVGLLCP